MSIWADIQDRSTGKLQKKEDQVVEEDNLWSFMVNYDDLWKQDDMIKKYNEIIQNTNELDKSIKKLKERLKGLY